MNKYLLYFLLLFGYVSSFAQVEIDRESFETTANLTSNNAFCASSVDCDAADNIWGVTNCTHFVGETGNYFNGMDMDACGPVGTYILTFCLTVPAGNDGEITFDFAAAAYSTGSGVLYESSDDVNIDISTNGIAGTYDPYFTTVVNNSTAPIYLSDFSTNTLLSTTFQTFSGSLGSGLAGQDICVRLTYAGMNSGAENFAIDEFVLYHTPPPCSANPGTLSK